MGNHQFAPINQLEAAPLASFDWQQLSFDTIINRKRGEYIYLPEESAEKVYFLLKGRVRLGAFSHTGKELIKGILQPNAVFGELVLIGETQRREFAYAMEKVTLGVLSARKVKFLMRKHPELGQYFMQVIGQQLQVMERRMEGMVFQNSRTRVIQYLYQLGLKEGQRVGYEMLVRQFLTHQEIANFTGTSRQTVTTILNELRNENILTFNRKRLLIRDMERLQRRC